MGFRTMPYVSRALVGPIVHFRHEAVPVERTPPRNTVDGDRWAQCTDHHLACDCREAELNEQIQELRGELRLIQNRLAAATEGHPTFVEERYSHQRRRDLECRCIACHVARALESTSAFRLYDNTIQI